MTRSPVAEFLWNNLAVEISHPHVYPPKPASLLLAREVVRLIRPEELMLDACTGTGIIALHAAKSVPQATVVATDLNPAAVKIAGRNAKRNGVRLEIFHGDMYAPVGHRRFDLIAVHPPAVPYAPGFDWGFTKGMRLATDGGPEGSDVIVRAIREAGAYLKSSGRLLLLLPFWSNRKSAVVELKRHFATFKIVAEESVVFFPAIDGRPTTVMLDYVKSQTEGGIIDIDFSSSVPRSQVAVILAEQPFNK